MAQSFTLEYWVDDGWYVGRLRGVPGVLSQGESLAALEENIRDAYRMMVEDEGPPPSQDAHTKEIEVVA
jgi:predicted RNase H-like HicB family nuclease